MSSKYQCYVGNYRINGIKLAHSNIRFRNESCGKVENQDYNVLPRQHFVSMCIIFFNHLLADWFIVCSVIIWFIWRFKNSKM